MQNVIIHSLTLAGKELLTKLIYDTYTIIQENEQHPKVQVVLEELDLEADLRVIEALVQQVEVSENAENIPDVVDVALYNVKHMIESIKKELEHIQNEQKYHRTRYLADYRDPAFHTNLSNLTRHKMVLDKRVDFLIKLLYLKKHSTHTTHLLSDITTSDAIGIVSDLHKLTRINTVPQRGVKSLFDSFD